MSLLHDAVDRLNQRSLALGAVAGAPVDVRGGDVPLVLSGLPVTIEELAPYLRQRGPMLLQQLWRGEPPDGVVNGAFVEWLLIGYYLARAEDGAR